jgi:DNA (cytosine-5)-methyltransferase 1
LNELALFSGAGGGILGGHLLGWRTVCAVEWEQYPASVLCARQNDGLLPPFPIWDDVQTFDGKPWRGIVDVVSGGFPCQDISAAGKGAGIDGERSGMWGEMARIIHEVRPKFVFVENSPMLTSRGLGRVLGDLASMGFDAKWGVLGAADIGANHKRDRIWIVAYTNSIGRRWRDELKQSKRNTPRKSTSISSEIVPREMAYANSTYGKRNQCTERSIEKRTFYGESSWWSVEPNVGRVADGVAARVDRLKAIGNGQVPLCAATAWRILK